MYYNTKILEIVKKSKNFYINYSKSKELTQKNYCKKITSTNLKTGEITTIKYSLVEKLKDDYLNLVMRTSYLQNEIISSDKLFTSFFITLTLPTEYHPFKEDNKTFNEKYDKNLSIHLGYKKLIEMFERLQKDMKFDNKKQIFKFIKVIEYHKSLIPHLHGIIFVPTEMIEKFKQHIKRVFGTNKYIQITKNSNDNVITQKHFKNNEYVRTTYKNQRNNKEINKVKYIDNENIGRSEIEQINDISRVVPYLLKYIKKSFNSDNKEDYYLLDGWKRKNKIRVFTMSNVSIPRFIFKKIYQNISQEDKKIIDSKENFNILEEIENMSDIHINYFKTDLENNENVYKRKQFVGKDLKYRVEVDIEKIDMVQYINNFTNYKKSFHKDYFNLSMILNDKEFFEDNRFDLLEDYEENEIKLYLDYLNNGTDYNDNDKHLKNMSDWCQRLGIVETDKRIDNKDFGVYSIKSFIITDLKTNKIIYDKSDFIYTNEN